MCIRQKIQSDGSLDKLKLITVVRGHLKNNYIIGDTWSATASMRTLKYFLADYSNQKARVHQLDLTRTFLQVNVKHIVFVKLDSRYGDYFLEYFKYFGIPLRPKKSMCGMNNYGKLFSDYLTNCLIYVAGFKQS